MHPNHFEYQPTKDLNRLLREYGKAFLSDTTPEAPAGNTNVMWQTDMKGNISAFVPTGGGGSGDVNPGAQFQIPFYETAGSTVSASSLTTSGSNLTVPALLSTSQFLASGVYFADRNPLDSSANEIEESFIQAQIAGAGWNFGNAGGWSTSSNEFANFIGAQRGITQNRAGVFTKHAIGDTAGFYSFTNADGGVAAQSDEGVTAGTFQCLENNGYFHGFITGNGGTGARQPTLGFTSGNGWTTDGAFLLNITKGTIAGNMTGPGTLNITMDQGSGAVATYLGALAVNVTSGGSALPISTAIGVAQAAIANPQVAANNPIPVSVTVNLVRIGGAFKPFTVGSVVSVAGVAFPEQSIITAATTPVAVGPAMQQTLTMNLRNPNSEAFIFQGGIQGQYISFDANLVGSGMRSSYYAFGSLTGTDLIYGFNVAGNIGITGGFQSGNQLPQVGNEFAQTSGANSGYHLYPGAEVVANTTTGFAPQLEQNGVTWDVNDVVENPHYPCYGGFSLFVNRSQTTPTNSSFGSATAAFIMDGPGTAGAGAQCILIRNSYSMNHGGNYTGSGGPLFAPTCFDIGGTFGTLMEISEVPDNGSVIKIDTNPKNFDLIDVVNLDFNGAGHLSFINSQNKWTVSGAFEANGGYLVGTVGGGTLTGASGTFTSADSKTITVTSGIITSIV